MLKMRYATSAEYDLFSKMNKSFLDVVGDAKALLTSELYATYTKDESIVFLLIDNNIIGYAMFFGYEDGNSTIKQIFIMPEYRRNGFGEQFVIQLKKIIKSFGFNAIELFSANMQTDKFWTKCGFSPIGLSDLYICMI